MFIAFVSPLAAKKLLVGECTISINTKRNSILKSYTHLSIRNYTPNISLSRNSSSNKKMQSSKYFISHSGNREYIGYNYSRRGEGGKVARDEARLIWVD